MTIIESGVCRNGYLYDKVKLVGKGLFGSGIDQLNGTTIKGHKINVQFDADGEAYISAKFKTMDGFKDIPEIIASTIGDVIVWRQYDTPNLEPMLCQP